VSTQVISTSGSSGGAGEEQFGVSNIEYDLIVTIGNLLQSQEVLAKYASDAETGGDLDTAVIFRELRDGNRQYVQRLRNALGRYVSNKS
jgi:uncharacterized protein involved in tellurium resistance